MAGTGMNPDLSCSALIAVGEFDMISRFAFHVPVRLSSTGMTCGVVHM